MIKEPLINPAKAGPRKVTTGRRPPFSAWRKTTRKKVKLLSPCCSNVILVKRLKHTCPSKPRDVGTIKKPKVREGRIISEKHTNRAEVTSRATKRRLKSIEDPVQKSEGKYPTWLKSSENNRKLNFSEGSNDPGW